MAVQRRRIRVDKSNLVDREWHAGKVTFENISNNYSISANYYQQKEEAFKNFWSNQLVNMQKQGIENFLNKAAKQTMEDYNYIVQKWMAIYDSLAEQNPALSSIEKEKLTKDIFISLIPGDVKIENAIGQSIELKEWVNGINKERSIFNILGFTTESILQKNLKNMVDSNSQSLIGIIGSGKVQGKSLITTGKKNVRADEIIYPSYLAINENDGSVINQKTHEILHFEAQADFTFEDVRKGALTDADILQSFEEYLNGDFAGVGGLIVKTYSLQRLENTNFLKFSESVPMQAHLNTLLSTANYQRGYLTQDFVDMYIIYHLSKFIPYIISPISIGFVSKEGFMWMSKFLETYRFYMRNKRGKKEGGYTKGKNLSTKWFKYSVPSPEIKIYNKNRTKAQFLKRISDHSYRYAKGTITSSIF